MSIDRGADDVQGSCEGVLIAIHADSSPKIRMVSGTDGGIPSDFAPGVWRPGKGKVLLLIMVASVSFTAHRQG